MSTALRTLCLFCLLCFAGFAGCVSLDQARDAAVQADHRLEQAEEAAAIAHQALETARLVAEQVDSPAARAAIEKARRAVETAESALPAAQQTARLAAESLEAAVAARDAGWTAGDWIAALVGAAVPAAGGIWASIRGRRWKQVAEHGLQLAQDLKKRARSAGVQVDERLQEAKAWQQARGVHQQVEQLRRRPA